MKKKAISNELKVGILIIIFAVTGFFVLYFMGDIKKDEGISYVIQFDQVGGIARGDFVRYAGVNHRQGKGRRYPPGQKCWTWSEKQQDFIPKLDAEGKQMVGDQAFVTILITDKSVLKREIRYSLIIL